MIHIHKVKNFGQEDNAFCCFLYSVLQTLSTITQFEASLAVKTAELKG